MKKRNATVRWTGRVKKKKRGSKRENEAVKPDIQMHTVWPIPSSDIWTEVITRCRMGFWRNCILTPS